MMRCRFALIALLTGGLAVTSAADRSPVLDEARKTLREDLPQVAAEKLTRWLNESDSVGEEHVQGIALLAEALVEAGKPDEALTCLAEIEGNEVGTTLLRARAYAALDRWADALAIYQSAGASPDAPVAVRLGEAECLSMLDRKAEAAAVLQRALEAGRNDLSLRLRLAELCVELQQVGRARQLLPAGDDLPPLETNWRSYIEGRIFLAEKQPLAAMENFEKLLDLFEKQKRLGNPVYLSDSLLFGATLGFAEARIPLSGYASAHGIIEKFINAFPQSAYLDAAFRRLDQIYQQEEEPDDDWLLKWVQRPPARRAALATFYLARFALKEAMLTSRESRERKYGKAEGLLNHFVANNPTHPLLCEANLMQADMYLAQNKLSAAVPALEAAMRHASNADQRAEIELRTGIVHHQQGEYLLAASLFRSAAERTPRLRTTATYNAALAWLNQRNDVRFADELRNLGLEPQSAALQSELLLEQGLVQARNGEIRAEETLQLFLHQNPKHPRAGEARLALAELAFQTLQASANPQQQSKAATQAAEYLQVANTEPRSGELAAHADYLAVFLADAQTPRNDARVLELGLDFIRKYPKSPLLSEVRMKLGQVYFRDEDFANAETQFATLAEEAPSSPYTETALFMAGKSAMGLAMNPGALDRALAFFDRVVKRDGSLKLYARQEQAIAQSQVGHEEEAIVLYDLILSAQPATSPELRFAALCGKGNSFQKLGRKNPEKLESAIAVFDQLANAPNVTPSWRNQALYKKAKALEQLGRMPEALTALYDVLERSNVSDREYFWSAKAGFDAGRILEQQEQWKSAIAIYNKLARLEGPRAADARSREKQLRLEHFVWE